MLTFHADAMTQFNDEFSRYNWLELGPAAAGGLLAVTNAQAQPAAARSVGWVVDYIPKIEYS